jgi:signal transduction histidine kinase
MTPPPLPPSSRSLVLLATIAQVLQSERSLALRLHDTFTLLHTELRYRDARLTCWLQSAQPGTLRQQFYSPDGWARPWDEGQTRQIALEGRIVRHRLPSLVSAVSERRMPTTAGIYLGAPIFWGSRLWGVLELRADHETDLNETDQELIKALLPLFAAAIAGEGERQYRASEPSRQLLALPESRLRREQLLVSFSQELEEPLTLHPLLNLLLRWALECTGAEAGAACIVDHQRSELVLQAYSGFEPDPPEHDTQGNPRLRWSWDTGLAGRSARSGRALLLRDVSQEPDLRMPAEYVRSELAAPISAEGKVLAVLVLDSPRSAAFSESELAFVNMLCERASSALRRALQYQEIVETNTQLGQVFGSLPIGLALLDVHGRVLRANPAWTTVWGLPEQRMRKLFHVPLDLIEELLPRMVEPLKLTEFCNRDQTNPDEVQTVMLRLNNPMVELQLRSVPTLDSLGRITGRLWAVSDVTREREVERLKDEFVSIVSHELRTPLTSILGYTELLLAREFPRDEQRQFIDIVYKQSEHLSQLVEDMLDISRLDAGRLTLNRWAVNLRRVVTELTNQLNAELDEKRHRLLIRIEDYLPPVHADRDKVRQILFNLLTNAIKYSPEGGEIELTIVKADSQRGSGLLKGPVMRLPEPHPPGNWLLISVRDQGLGIAPEDQPRIWNRFFRVDNTNTRRIGGTGLGLSITKALVELHGGLIWLESELGQGSVFAFTLPIVSENQVPALPGH